GIVEPLQERTQVAAPQVLRPSCYRTPSATATALSSLVRGSRASTATTAAAATTTTTTAAHAGTRAAAAPDVAAVAQQSQHGVQAQSRCFRQAQAAQSGGKRPRITGTHELRGDDDTGDAQDHHQA